MSDKTTLGERAKGYERATRTVLPMRVPVILRLDGKAFHTYCGGLKRPFDDRFIDAMDVTAVALCAEIQGAQIAYVQSDEISVLVHNYKRLKSAAWFDNEVQKMVSVGASIAGATMTVESARIFGEVRPAYFDARVFVVPERDVCNCFLWREQDAARNSVQMVAQSMYSQRELHGKHTGQLQEMIYQRSGKNWNDLPTHLKRGRCVLRQTYDVDGARRSRWVVDREIPLFSQDRDYIERHLAVEPEDAETVPRFGEDAA